MEDDKNPKFDDLFQDFFKEKVEGLDKETNDKEIVMPSPQISNEVNINTIISDLLIEDKQELDTEEPPPKESKKVPKAIDVPKKIRQNAPNEIAITEAINIEGGASAFIANPEYLAPRSHEVDEILSFVPHWMIRWGITTIFAIVLGIIAMSYFIKYPDIVAGQITISSSRPPASVIAKASGPLKLFKKDKDIIEEGEVIALIRNDAKYEDVLKLKKSLEILKTEINKGQNLTYFEFPRNLDLGSLQGAYADLEFKIKDKRVQANSRGNDSRRKANIDNQISEIYKIQKEQVRHILSLQSEYIKVKEVYDKRYQALFKNGSISAEQLENKQSEVTQKQNAYQSAKLSLSENKKQILDLESRKDELDYGNTQTESTGLNSISMSYSQLLNDINTWENQFLLTAPIAGRLNYLQFIKDNVQAESTQELASIVPIFKGKSRETIGELFIPAVGMGKVKLGQTVNVDLDAFLKKEYGVIIGKVTEIADVGTTLPSSEGAQTVYKLVVTFDNGLKPTSGKDIKFKHNMKGKAEVITKDVRLIERIFNELRDVVDAK